MDAILWHVAPEFFTFSWHDYVQQLQLSKVTSKCKISAKIIDTKFPTISHMKVLLQAGIESFTN